MDQTSKTEPFIYVIIPLIALFVIGCLALTFYMKHRRRRTMQSYRWPTRRVYAPDGHVILTSRHGRNPWITSRSEEGLNELGEAPPPYEGKKRTPGENATASEEEGVQLRDVEQGTRPPEYIAEPPPALTTDSRRSGP
ncbi:hypothetical protein PT974_05781 [Cladobotryum mycophilum]|uniref:Uncharacterized protein n=1 Tax=Cladobotryum mycophilum TaxID=491253 RepID=A0ABR0SJR1_9HYPO